MAFRYEGVAWDGQRWRVALAIKTLGQQIEAAFPDRKTTLDGTVASKGHDERDLKDGYLNSDHTVKPIEASSGIVYAIDITEDVSAGFSADDFAEAVRKSEDPRLKYLIHDRRMFSGYPKGDIPPFTWRPYTKAMHKYHVHVSVWNDDRSENDQPWSIGVEMGFLTVENLQEALNEAGVKDYEGKELVVDGKYGPRTKSAFVKGLRSKVYAVDDFARGLGLKANNRLDSLRDFEF